MFAIVLTLKMRKSGSATVLNIAPLLSQKTYKVAVSTFCTPLRAPYLSNSGFLSNWSFLATHPSFAQYCPSRPRNLPILPQIWIASVNRIS